MHLLKNFFPLNKFLVFIFKTTDIEMLTDITWNKTTFGYFQAVTLNRYVATERPYDYKLWCTKRRTMYILVLTVVVGTTFLIPEVTICLGLANTASEEVYIVVWACTKALLTAICGVFSGILFKSISKQFHTSPFAVPFLLCKQQQDSANETVICRYTERSVKKSRGAESANYSAFVEMAQHPTTSAGVVVRKTSSANQIKGRQQQLMKNVQDAEEDDVATTPTITQRLVMRKVPELQITPVRYNLSNLGRLWKLVKIQGS